MVNLEFLNTSIIYIAIVVGITNVGLLLGLVYFYWKSYEQLKSKFTVGLLYFTGILLAQNILVTLALVVLLILGKGELNQLEGLELIALIVLSKITWE